MDWHHLNFQVKGLRLLHHHLLIEHPLLSLQERGASLLLATTPTTIDVRVLGVQQAVGLVGICG